MASSGFLPRGGKRQRLRHAFREAAGGPSSGAEASTQHGPLEGDEEVELLIEYFALGILSAAAVRDICAASNRVSPRPQAEALASLGGSGSVRSNVHRDLVRKLKLGTINIAEPILVDLPMWSMNATSRHRPGRVPQKYPVMLPHELLASIYTAYPNKFQTYIVGPRPLRDFWTRIDADDPRIRAHPVLRVERYADRAIPLRLHGDGVPIGKAKRRSLDVISISSLVGKPGKTLDTKLILSGVVDGAKCDDQPGQPGTMHEIWRILFWYFAVLLNGHWPAADWDGCPWPEDSWRANKAGQRLCGEFVFALMCIAADLDYLCNYLGLRHFNAGVFPALNAIVTAPPLHGRTCALELVGGIDWSHRHNGCSWTSTWCSTPPGLGPTFGTSALTSFTRLILGSASMS